jgi:hypothetical protein
MYNKRVKNPHFQILLQQKLRMKRHTEETRANTTRT